MHAAYRRSSNRLDATALFNARFADPVRPVADPIPTVRAVYGERTGPNWVAILAILGAHALLLVILVRADVLHIKEAPPAPLVVDLISITPPPPPKASPEPTLPSKTVQSAVVVPAPVVVTPVAAPPPLFVSPTPPPPRPAAVASPAPKAVAAADLSSTMISAKPPRYPTESRRKHEQGVVTLSLTLGTDGSVAQIALAHSSGFERLDKAALEAVRRWRWSPTVRDGQPVTVRGFVEIPFVLT